MNPSTWVAGLCAIFVTFTGCERPEKQLPTPEAPATTTAHAVEIGQGIPEREAANGEPPGIPAARPTAPLETELRAVRLLAERDPARAAKKAAAVLDTFLYEEAAPGENPQRDEVRLSPATWSLALDLFAEVATNSEVALAAFVEEVEKTVSQPFIEALIAREMERDPVALWQQVMDISDPDLRSSLAFHYRAHLIDEQGSREAALAALVRYAPETSAKAHWGKLQGMRGPR